MIANILHPQPVDMLGEYAERLPVAEVTELQNQFNVNLLDAEDNGETWFDDEIPVGYTTVIDEQEFFDRYFGEQA